MVKERGPMTEAMYYVLLALHQPLHGYALMEAIADISCGRIHMGPGTLYGVLSRLQKDQFIQLTEADGRRKVYRQTESGRKALKLEYNRLTAMVEDGKQSIEGENNDG